MMRQQEDVIVYCALMLAFAWHCGRQSEPPDHEAGVSRAEIAPVADRVRASAEQACATVWSRAVETSGQLSDAANDGVAVGQGGLDGVSPGRVEGPRFSVLAATTCDVDGYANTRPALVSTTWRAGQLSSAPAPTWPYPWGKGDVARVACKHGIPPRLLVRLARVESNLNPRAYNARTRAAGMFQLVPIVQQRYGVTDPFDAGQSATAAARYLRSLHNRFGTWQLAVGAYGCGPARARLCSKYVKLVLV